jgi:GxxExxY protein
MEANNSIKPQYKYSDITAKIIGCSMEVHKLLGNGFTHFLLIFICVCECKAFQEVIYQRALEIELSGCNLIFNREFEMPIFYKNNHIGTRRVDFLIQDIISVELKAIIKLEDVHFAQAINYLEAYNLEVGLLINFGAKSLEFKRLINSKYKS